MDQTQDFKSLQDQIQSALIATTRSAGQIAAEDLGFHRSFNPEVGTALNEQSERMLSLASALLKSAVSISELRSPALDDADDVENNWRSVVDVVDLLLEKSDTCLDEYTGVIKRRDLAAEQSSQTPTRPKRQSLGPAFRNQNLLKPQLAFHVKPDNLDHTPWKPLLTSKPHASVPLEEALGSIDGPGQQQYDYSGFLPLLKHPATPVKPEGLSKSARARLNKRIRKMKDRSSMTSPVDDTDQLFRYLHPYQSEILNLRYPEAVYQKADPIPYLPVDSTSATFVDTEEGVMEMLAELKQASEIAVDLEHHDQRSYIGLVSLMQISTRERDWIVDTLKPWRLNLQVLNEVFADPNIIKVFHGAYMDIVWLQRDLGLYVVGLFDTHWAARALGYAAGSLAFLLKKFIDFDADKQYQLADWRIRPIPDEMFFYARADTHYLLYIYDHMRNELIDKSNPEIPEQNKMELVLQQSKETSLQRYERPVYNADSGRGPGGWYTQLVKTPDLLNKEQLSVFKAVHEWRDRIARIDDESPVFIMQQSVLASIAKLIPMDMVALLAVVRPISHSVKSRAGELLSLIKTAKARGATGPSMVDILRPGSAIAVPKAKTAAKNVSRVSEPLVAVVDQSELRSDNSAFWGGAFGSSVWDAPNPVKNDHLRLAVPLPALSSEIFAPSKPFTPRSARETDEILNPPTPTPASKQSPIEEQPFVLKRGVKRKSGAISGDEEGSQSEDGGSPKNADQISLEAASGKESSAEKAARKAAHRAEKKARKAAKKAAAAETKQASDEEDDEPFDYSKAESVLHAKRGDESKKGDKGKKGKKEPFDPYQKSADAPKGMRRAQTERAGKSHTFRN